MKLLKKEVLSMVAAAGLAAVGMGSSCPGTSSTAQFTDPSLGAITPTAASTVFSNSWQTPMFFDLGAAAPGVASSDFSCNLQLATALPSEYPMAVFNDGPASFYGIFNASNQILPSAPTNVSAYVTHLADISSAWVTSDSAFTQLLDSKSPAALAPFTGAVTEHPVTTVDGLGNIVAVLSSKVQTTNNMRPVAFRHLAGGSAWGTMVDLSNETPATPGAGVSLGATLIAGTDAAANQVVVWVQGAQIFFNEFRPNLGWRFSDPNVPNFDTTTVSVPPGVASIAGAVLDRGADMGFDPMGNGYVLFTATLDANPAIIAQRWRSDMPVPISAVQDLTVVSANPASPLAGQIPFGYPRVVVNPDGSAIAFWLQNYNSMLATAELWSATAPPTSLGPATLWANQARFDDQGAPGSAVFMAEGTLSGTSYYKPIVAQDGPQAAVGYVEFDGTCRRLFVHANAYGWSSIGPADLGGPGADVHWAQLAINQAGTIVAVYSANGAIDNLEHIYGNVFSNGYWQGATELDGGGILVAGGDSGPGGTNSTQSPFPMVSLDEVGNAVVVFTMQENILSWPARRAVSVVYTQ